MKIKFVTILTILCAFCLFNSVYADEEVTFNSKEWTFKMLTDGSDQNKEVKVSKYYNYYDQSKYVFCIEPKQIYLPVGSEYTIDNYSNENVFNIVKAYDHIGKDDDNYYIAAQILIWEELDGTKYTFNNLDYSEYKNKLLNYINGSKLLTKSSNIVSESYVGEEATISVDYSEYDIESEGVKILLNDSNGIKYIIKDELPEIKTLKLNPKDSDEAKSFVFKSEESQDLYYHDGEYNDMEPIVLNLRTLYKPISFNLYYSKVDENDIPISGAEFTVYKEDINEDSEEIIFIKNDKDIDIYEAILGNYSNYEDIYIKTSERYQRYINSNIIHAKEEGYFDYKIYSFESLIKEGRVYVTNDDRLCNESYFRINAKVIFKGYSEDLLVNSINNLPTDSKLYLCESEPKKGYEYESEPCVIVDGKTYDETPYKFINSDREYTLRLMKQSPEDILLDGAKFKITYINNEIEENLEFTTGALIINRDNPKKYLILKYENDENPIVIEPGNSIYEDLNAKEGKYYYYEADSPIVNDSLLNNKYVTVLKGGFIIENLPYSSLLTIEELVPPKGYVITEPVYKLTPDLKYSEITFRNYRINTIDIIPAQKFKIPKTCVNG